MFAKMSRERTTRGREREVMEMRSGWKKKGLDDEGRSRGRGKETSTRAQQKRNEERRTHDVKLYLRLRIQIHHLQHLHLRKLPHRLKSFGQAHVPLGALFRERKLRLGEVFDRLWSSKTKATKRASQTRKRKKLSAPENKGFLSCEKGIVGSDSPRLRLTKDLLADPFLPR